MAVLSKLFRRRQGGEWRVDFGGGRDGGGDGKIKATRPCARIAMVSQWVRGVPPETIWRRFWQIGQ